MNCKHLFHKDIIIMKFQNYRRTDNVSANTFDDLDLITLNPI